jgi:hypothetical protein
MGPLSLKLHWYHPRLVLTASIPTISRYQGASTLSPGSGVGGDAEHCRETSPVSGFDGVPMLSPMLGEGGMTGERISSENVGRSEGMCMMMVNGHLVESEGMS